MISRSNPPILLEAALALNFMASIGPISCSAISGITNMNAMCHTMLNSMNTSMTTR